MKNEKFLERERVTFELALLVQPIVDLANRAGPPRPHEYRIALARVQSGDAAWRASVRAFTTFAPDVVFNTEFQEISHIPEMIWRRLKPLLDDDVLASRPDELQARVKAEVKDHLERYFRLVERVPLEWEPEVFEANTPFTSYKRIMAVLRHTAVRLHYFDRYLKPEFFDLFLYPLRPAVEIVLVTTAQGVRDVRAVSALFEKEHPDYRLLEVDPRVVHDRNLRVDDRIFSLGPGVDRAGIALTNFGPGDSSPESHARFDAILSAGTVVHGSSHGR